MKKIFVFCLMFILFSSAICGSSMVFASADGEIDLTSKSACLVDYESGEVLFEKDSEVHLPIASMVKMMTILLTLEEIENGNLTKL